ncbi:MAG: ribosome small subunit-dependent GTPase A [Bacteroidales bacterium]|nr:ribosome small subunit-dependent GTPase A [Bacteroidales bacterium]
MNIFELGYNQQFEDWRNENSLADFEIGRVVAEHKERYIVKTATTELDAEITGNLRFTARSREDFPAVGDWVALVAYDQEMAIIHRIFPRQSMLFRKAVGQAGELQIIATNIDYALLLQAVDRDFNINRLQRYLTIANNSKVSPVIILTKTDLIDNQKTEEITNSIKKRISDVPVIGISNETEAGMDELQKFIISGKTYCMLGSSGVGKSTLLNKLSGKNLMKTGAISDHTNRGKHITSHRELTLLENGAILIDNPGMREVGIADSSEGLETTFDEIMEFAGQCKFKDCTHTSETGCAVLKAVEAGNIDPESYQNYLKMEREKAHFESSAAERKKRDKLFGRIMKDYKKKDIKQRKG